MSKADTIGVGIIGSGGIALANHLPGFTHCPGAKVVALCDSNSTVLEQARARTGIDAVHADYRELIERKDVHAVVIATPNHVHAPIAKAAVAAGKHVLCEKPLALSHAEAVEMLQAAEAAGVRHMTAFTYRFVPAMVYVAHLAASGALGRIYHVRVQRFQDWGQRALGWRQVQALAGSGELGDMLSHRIDFALLLAGPIKRVVAQTRRFIDDRSGQPSDLEDFVGVLADFDNGATGVFESTKLATGRGEGGKSPDYCEINGSKKTLVYRLEHPLEIEIGEVGGAGLLRVPVPEAFLKWPGSTRDPKQGDPLVTFRYDQDAEFIAAIREGRPCRPSFHDGVRAQAVMDAALASVRDGAWATVPETAC
jgi:predicted dehydrogenase